MHCRACHARFHIFNLFKQVCYSWRQVQKRKWPLDVCLLAQQSLFVCKTYFVCHISVLFSISAYVHPTEARMWRMHSLKLRRRSTRTFRTAAWTWTRLSQGSSTSLPLPRVGGSTVTHSPRRRAAAVNDQEDFTRSLSLFLPVPHPTSASLCI